MDLHARVLFAAAALLAIPATVVRAVPAPTADALIARWENAVGGLAKVAAVKAVYREAVIEFTIQPTGPPR